jgi:hypothetical protein
MSFDLDIGGFSAMQGTTYTSQAVSAADIPLEDVSRVDIEFEQVDHSGASFEGRVFLNNPQADENTEPSPENGYAGSFFIFGHGGCFGDEGHCEVDTEPEPVDPYDPRRSHPLRPVEMSVEATEAVLRTASEGGEITVSVVPVITGLTEQTDLENVFKFDGHPRIVTYKTESQTT